MTDYKLVVSKLNEALSIVRDRLLDTQIDFIESCIYSGEWNLALETLCDILSEDNLPLHPGAYKLFEEIGSDLNIERGTWEILKMQATY